MRHSRIDRLLRQRSFTLCRHQSVVHFGLVSLPVDEATAGPLAPVPLIWAIGTLADGQREQLGVWLVSRDADSSWEQVLGDLWIRGVERIGLAEASGFTAPSIRHLPQQPRIDLSSSACAPSLQSRGRLASAAKHSARAIQAHLARSVRRHGSFESNEAAVGFVAARLEHLDLGGAIGQ